MDRAPTDTVIPPDLVGSSKDLTCSLSLVDRRKTAPRAANPETVLMLKTLLNLAEKGEISEISWATTIFDGSRDYGFAGRAFDDPANSSGTVARLQVALNSHNHPIFDENY